MNGPAQALRESLQKLRPGRPIYTPPLLGEAGFRLPELDGLLRFRPGEIPPSPGLRIVQHPEVGGENWLFVPADFAPSGPLTLAFTRQSRGNIVIFAPGANPFGTVSLFGQDGLVVFCSTRDRSAASFKINLGGYRQTFYMGASGSSNGLNAFFDGTERSILLGQDTMVSHDVAVMCTDSHAVVQRSTFTHLNPPADVVVEPHVWLGRQSMVLKGTTIGFGSIIGARAVVTRDVARYTSVAGMPAKPVRADTTWTRRLTPTAADLAELSAIEAEFFGVAS